MMQLVDFSAVRPKEVLVAALAAISKRIDEITSADGDLLSIYPWVLSQFRSIRQDMMVTSTTNCWCQCL